MGSKASVWKLKPVKVCEDFLFVELEGSKTLIRVGYKNTVLKF